MRSVNIIYPSFITIKLRMRSFCVCSLLQCLEAANLVVGLLLYWCCLLLRQSWGRVLSLDTILEWSTIQKKWLPSHLALPPLLLLLLMQSLFFNQAIRASFNHTSNNQSVSYTDTEWAFTVSIFLIGGMVGSLPAGVLADLIGRWVCTRVTWQSH